MTRKPQSQSPALAALLAGLLGLLAACSSLGESVPASVGGLPADTPARPAAAPAYPAVHDMPPVRPTPVLDDESQKKLEGDLVSARDRQDGRQPDERKPLEPLAPPPKLDAGAAGKP